MTRMLLLWLAAVASASGEFHVLSRIEYSGTEGTDFGFSLSYQRSKQKLIVGTPRIDLEGGVESCPIWSKDKEKSCDFILQSKNMNSSWGEFSREVSPNQHFLLGATVAATLNYVLACAPLFTKKWENVNSRTNTKSTKYPAIGRCFIQRDSSNPEVLTNPRDMKGTGSSLGWSALVDEENDTLLISKPTGQLGTFMYTQVSAPGALARADLTLEKSQSIKDGRYIGSALTSGVFFSNVGKVYANSWEDTTRVGYVGFLHFVNNHLKAVTTSKNSKRKVFIKSRRGQNMFGASLLMVDFTRDGYSELVVSAPAEPYKHEHEAGAIYIYRGGHKAVATIRESAICVTHNSQGSRFGTALASMDLDSDGLPELFISAPYEKNGGVVYVVPGEKIGALLEKGGADCTLVSILITENNILSSEHKSFGYVIQPVLNFDDNGGNILAVGAPLASKVFVYRSIPAVRVTVSLKLKDKEIVRELDKDFTVTVTINITYPAKSKTSSGYLFLQTSLTTDLNQTMDASAAPVIENDRTFTIDLSKREAQVTKDIVVKLNDDLPHTYDFFASVHSDKSLLAKKEFDESLIRLSDGSIPTYNLQILRKCKGDECVPRLSMALKWSQSSKDYVLGSSQFETVIVAIKNDGNSSYESCAKVNIKGAMIADWNCDEREIRDICRFTELKSFAEHSLTIKLDMSKVSYRTEKLDIAVDLYSKCPDEKPTQTDGMSIKYILNTDEIDVKGFYYPLNVTDRDIEDGTSPTVDLLETFTITNNGSVVWEDLETEIKIIRQPYIYDFVILNQDNSNYFCSKENNTDFIIYQCLVDLEAKSYIELKTKVNILKKAVVNNLNDVNLLFFNTDIDLDLTSTHKNFSLEATAMYLKDTSFKNHKNYILIVAILVSIIILLIIGVILYKCGFFERNTKKELNEMKKEYRRRSTIRRPESTYHRMSTEGELHIEELTEENENLSCTTAHPKSS